MEVIISSTTYTLATTLRVAYEMQNQNNHRAYSEIFRDLGSMCLEDQIGLLYCAFKVANPEESRRLDRKAFIEYYLDNFTLKNIMDQLKGVIRGITGETEEEERDSTKNSGN